VGGRLGHGREGKKQESGERGVGGTRKQKRKGLEGAAVGSYSRKQKGIVWKGRGSSPTLLCLKTTTLCLLTRKYF
jgi:hypothetical protein